MLKNVSTEYSEPMVREEQRFVLENPHERELSRIFEIAHVQYGRIDYAIKDGRVQTWEINLNPTLLGGRPGKTSLPPELAAIRRETNEHFYRRFQRAWEALDAGGEDAAPIPVRFSPETPTSAGKLSRTRRHSSWRRTLRKRLSPLRPAAIGLGRALSPLLVGLARRSRA